MDLEVTRTSEVNKFMTREEILGIDASMAIPVSAKAGIGIENVLESIGFKIENIINFNLHSDEDFDKLIFICKKA